jgi:uncharacterized protein (DUF302 family)
MFRKLAGLILGISLSSAALAGEVATYTVEEDIDDVLFSVENEIIGRGYKIDSVSKVGAMLERTRLDVGGTKKIFREAQIFSFCSAKLSREMMEIDPANLRYCPYKVFMYATIDNPDITIVGYDTYPEGEMKKIEALLEAIVKDALGLD